MKRLFRRRVGGNKERQSQWQREEELDKQEMGEQQGKLPLGKEMMRF